MTEVNFGSTFRIPVTQQGVNKAKKVKLKGLVDSYGGLVGTGNTGYARVSIPNEKDESFLRKLKSVGYKVFQVFEGENISRKSLDDYIILLTLYVLHNSYKSGSSYRSFLLHSY